jgi:drug/metabolite transporter (DMT)-like permease
MLRMVSEVSMDKITKPQEQDSAKPHPSGWLLVLAFAAAYLVWGSTYLGIKYAIETLPPFLMAGTRFLLAGGALYAWARLVRKDESPTHAHWRTSLIVGGLLLLGGNGMVVWAEHSIPSSLAALLWLQPSHCGSCC